MYIKDLNIGEKFGEWTVIEKMSEIRHGHRTFKVKCSCGNEMIFTGYYLRAEKSEYCRSCSAKKRFLKGDKSKKFIHGYSLKGNPARDTYKVWVVMKQRCNNPNDKSYKNYGARGITVCNEWNDFEIFLKDMGICPKGLSLERIDNEKGYCKENCKWETRSIQNNNRRDNTFFMINGIRVVRTQIQEKLKWTRDMYRRRFEKYGPEWIVEQYKNL